MNEYSEPVESLDTRVMDGKVYVSLESLRMMNSSLAMGALLAVPQAYYYAVSWPLDRYRVFYEAVELKHALETVPDTAEPFTS